MKSKMQEVVQDKMNFKLKLDEQKDRLEGLAEENRQLKVKVTDMETEAREGRKMVKSL